MMNDEQITDLLRSVKRIAVVGLSDKPWRPSYGVSEYMKSRGYEVIPVNPRVGETLGEHAYRNLDGVPGKIDLVNIFRRSEYVSEIVDAAIRIGACAVWMQEGVIDPDSAARAAAAGLGVVMDRCILKEHRRLIK